MDSYSKGIKKNRRVVRNESEMFWGTLEWAIFKSAD